jgi:hypothetical protein
MAAHRSRDASSIGSWLPLAAPPVVWAVQGGTGWFIASRVCRHLAPSSPVARWLLAGVTLAALGVILWSGAASAVRWHDPLEDGETAERRRFVDFAAMLVSAALAVGVVLAGLPLLFAAMCGEAR